MNNTLQENLEMSALPSVNGKINRYVEKLQQRIYHAESNGEKRKVRELQRLLMRSEAALVVSIHKVTVLNQGKRTAGVDGYKALTPSERVKLYIKMQKRNVFDHEPKPAYRTYIRKKSTGKLRPLGIPTIIDRVYQNIIKLALEAQWEAKFEPTSYGFRPKRSTHDAIERIFNTLRHESGRRWIFEGDFKGCFDNLSHEYIINCLEGFPATELITKWLKAGFVDNGVFEMTEAGTPQGGIISPLLANIALHGMEKALGIKYTVKGNLTPYAICRYADDFVVMCRSEIEALKVYEKLDEYLKVRGLTLAENKTKITHIEQGFDFLGFNVRKYENGEKLLIKPSKDSIKAFKTKVAELFKNNHGDNVKNLIYELNPLIIGTANYWSSVVSKEIFNGLGHYIWLKVKRFLRRAHPKKSWKWLRKKYFKPDKTGQSKDRWILTDPITGNQLRKIDWTPIVRHEQVKHDASPFDSNLKEYYKRRDRKEFDRNNLDLRRRLANRQKYVCTICKSSITDGREGLEIHHKIPKTEGGTNELKNLRLHSI